MLERETGLEIGRATLDGWVMRVGDLLLPIVEVMHKDLLTATYLQADETTIPVQMHDGRGSNHPTGRQGPMLGYIFIELTMRNSWCRCRGWQCHGRIRPDWQQMAANGMLLRFLRWPPHE